MKLTLRSLRRFVRDRRGLAALEFALIAPLMVTVLFGSVELTGLLNTNRRAENTSASVADIIARDTEVTNTEMSDLWSASSILMYPDASTPLKMRVSSVQVQTPTQATVLWSDGYNGYAARGVGSSVTLPSAMMITGTSVIIAETTYRYTPPIGVFLKIAMDLNHTEYRRPRVVDPVVRK